MNSIRSNQNKNDTISSIKLNLHHPSFNGFHIIVEGISDIKFLNSMMKNISFYESFSGKQGIFEILTNIESQYVIAICDMDYDKSHFDRVFYYDGNSMETMILTNNSVVSKILDEFLVQSEQKDDFIKNLFSCARPLSIIREQNFLNDWGLRFTGIKPSHYIKNKLCDLDLLIDKCSEINSTFDRRILDEIDFNEANMPNNMLHGHDLTGIFAHIVEHCIKQENVEMIFRIAYSINDFKKTELSKSIQAYFDSLSEFSF